MTYACDHCSLNIYDDELDAYFCEAHFDEDELYRLQNTGSCPYFRSATDDDDYQLVRHQK